MHPPNRLRRGDVRGIASRLHGCARLIAGFVLAAAPSASAEPFFDASLGKSFTGRSRIHVRQPSIGSDFRVHDVGFDDDSFAGPLWYSLRAGYFLESRPWLGFGVELLHFKVFADTAEEQRVSGTYRGTAIDAVTRVDSIVQGFDVSHGVNYVTADLLLRYPLLRDGDRFPYGRIQPYAGTGLGMVVTHAENRIDQTDNHERYEIGGVGVQAFTGVRFQLIRWFGLFAEYKFTHSDLDVGVANGEAGVSDDTHHFCWGITLSSPWIFR